MKNIPRADSTQDNANKFQVLSVQFSAKRASISGPALGLTTPHPGLLPVEGRRNAEPRCRMFDRAGDFAAGAGPKNRMSSPTAGNLWRLRCGDIAAWKRRSNQVRSAECGITAEPGRRPVLRGGGGQNWSNQFGVRNASTIGNWPSNARRSGPGRSKRVKVKKFHVFSVPFSASIRGIRVCPGF